jgi:hypothetical protein
MMMDKALSAILHQQFHQDSRKFFMLLIFRVIENPEIYAGPFNDVNLFEDYCGK